MFPIAEIIQLNRKLCVGIMLLTAIVVFAQIMLIFQFAIPESKHQCDQPIVIYLFVYSAYIFIEAPISIFVHIADYNDRDERVYEMLTRVKTCLDLFGFLWFIYGNYIIFITSNCASTVPSSYYLMIFLIVYGYLVLIIPGIFSVIHLMIPSYLLRGDADDIIPRATTEEVCRLRTFKYDERTNRNDNETCSICAICLAEYTRGDKLCKLWCKHQFHIDCLDDWLKVNTLCPMCKRDFRRGHAIQHV